MRWEPWPEEMLKLTEERDVAWCIACSVTKASGNSGLLAQLSGAWEGMIPGWQRSCDDAWLEGQGLLRQRRAVVALKPHSCTVLY